MPTDEPEIQFPAGGRRTRRSAMGGRKAACEPPVYDEAPAREPAHELMTSSAAAAAPHEALESMTEAVWGLPEIEAFTVRAVETVLRRRGVDTEEVQRPNMEIAVPAVEAMRYSPLREEIATLIASSMDAATASAAHPAFLTILRQLTRDEVSMLQALPPKGQFFPMAHVYVTTTRDQVRMVQRNVVPAQLNRVCAHPERVAGYIDNLIRLQLIHEPEGVPLPDASFYSALTREEACQTVLRDRNLRRRSRIEKRILTITDFGETFREVCLG